MMSQGIPILSRAALLGGLVSLSVSCARTVNDSLVELKHGDTESVKQAVLDLGEILSQKEKAGIPQDEGDKEALEYLRELSIESPDDVIRACALSSLGRLKRTASTEVFATALEDMSAHWVVRLEAARALKFSPRPEATGTLAKQLAEEPRLEVKCEIIKAAQAAGGDEALRAILEFYFERSRRTAGLRMAAYNAAIALSGQNFGFEDTVGWKEYYAERFGPEGAPVPSATEETPAMGIEY